MYMYMYLGVSGAVVGVDVGVLYAVYGSEQCLLDGGTGGGGDGQGEGGGEQLVWLRAEVLAILLRQQRLSISIDRV